MKLLVNSFVLVLLASSSLVLYAQSGSPLNSVVNCSNAVKTKKTSKTLTISAGVLNGRAVKLVKPDFPPAASAVNVKGSVQISVLIDERGCVAEAKAISGHPLLISSSLKAAKASIFEPTLISNNSVRVYGVIVYNYTTERMNWLELGYSSDSYDSLLKYIPIDFDRERKLLEQSKIQSLDEKKIVLETVVDSIHEHLSGDTKNSWLFSVGSQIKSLSRQDWSV